MRARALATFLVVAATLACVGCGDSPRDPPPSPSDVDWPSWGNTTENTHFAALSQVDTANVDRLRRAWTATEGFGQYDWETFPVVVNSTMYYTTSTDGVLAVNAATGKLRWSYAPEVDFLLGPREGDEAVEPVSRGVAVGGGRVYDLTYDDQLIALDARTGKRLWDVRVADPELGYSENSPGTYFDGEIIVGGPAGDAGLRGFVAAYDAATGHQLWRTYVIPARGQGWRAPSAANGGGDVWMPPTVDPRTDTVYVSTGDPDPAFTNATRKGCDRWTDATLALNARTGAIQWGHTEVCEDSWDYDTDQAPMLLDVHVHGRVLRAVGDASKSGFYSILDARTGSLIARTPELTRYSRPHLRPTPTGAVVCPGIYGGLEYGPPAYSPPNHLVYVPGIDMCMRYKVNSQETIEAHRIGEGDLQGTAEQVGPATGLIAAVDPATGQVDWRRSLPRPAVGGALATAGGLVLVGDDNGYLYALDAHTGTVLWRKHLGLRFGSAPIAYQIAGVEYIAIVAGGSQVSAKGEAPTGEGKLFVFRLGG